MHLAHLSRTRCLLHVFTGIKELWKRLNSLPARRNMEIVGIRSHRLGCTVPFTPWVYSKHIRKPLEVTSFKEAGKMQLCFWFWTSSLKMWNQLKIIFLVFFQLKLQLLALYITLEKIFCSEGFSSNPQTKGPLCNISIVALDLQDQILDGIAEMTSFSPDEY